MSLDPRHYLKYSKVQMSVAAEVIEQIHLRGDEKILDVGCGDGKITALLHEMAQEAVGIDLCTNMIAFASELFPHLTFEQHNAEEMAFENRFDVITCLSALHWMRNPVKALVQMKKALKRGGRAYILTYPKESIYWQPSLRTLADPRFSPYQASAAPIHSAAHYLEMAKMAGFEIPFHELKEHFASHQDIEEAKAYIRGWLPSFIPLPDQLMDPFIQTTVQYQLSQAVDQGDGQLHLPYTKLVMVLQRPLV